jgi:acetylglutamate/LysW-gamma-L-alpha-aminoadipate kinase
VIGMVIVAKIGDKVMGAALSAEALDDLERICRRNAIVLVHGGGNTVTKVAEKLGIPQKFVFSPEGFRSRYTDIETIRVFTMVMAGKINKEIVLLLQSRKIPAIGLSGLDGALIRAERKKRLIIRDGEGRRRVIEGGYTGRITDVDRTLLQILLVSGYVPVIAPIALGSENEPLNLDGDRTASHIAAALKADLLLLMTDVNGVSLNGSYVSRLSSAEARGSLESLGPGMITKVHSALDALSMGVGKVIIAPGASGSPFTSAIQEQAGTVIEP